MAAFQPKICRTTDHWLQSLTQENPTFFKHCEIEQPQIDAKPQRLRIKILDTLKYNSEILTVSVCKLTKDFAQHAHVEHISKQIQKQLSRNYLHQSLHSIRNTF